MKTLFEILATFRGSIIAAVCAVLLGLSWGYTIYDLRPQLPGQQYEVAALDESGLRTKPKLSDYLAPTLRHYSPPLGKTDVFFFVMRPEIDLSEPAAQVRHACDPAAYEAFWYKNETMFESGAWSLEKMACVQIRMPNDATYHPLIVRGKEPGQAI